MIPGSANPLLMAAAQDTGYNVSRSLRFNASDSAFLSRTPGSAGNRKTWTFSCWIKRGRASTGTEWFYIFDANSTTGSGENYIRINGNHAGHTLSFYSDALGAGLTTSQVFRDHSAWFHLVAVLDTTLATASDRMQLYINGSRVTAFSSATYPTQNADGGVNNGTAHTIGSKVGGDRFFDGYLAECHLIDGAALTASSFGETNATTGQWVPKAFSGSYGTNGFRLDFSDNSGVTATTLGKDRAGSNNFTPNNFSVAAGAGNDSLVDTPVSSGTDTSLGGEVRGNYATLNPLSQGSQITLSNGNLDYSHTGTTVSCQARSTIAMTSGKWYCEHTTNSGGTIALVGIVSAAEAPNSGYVGQSSTSYGYYASNGRKYNNSVETNYGATYTSGDVIGIAFDADSGTLTFYKNGVSQGTAFSSIPSGTYLFAQGNYPAGTYTGSFNFGQRPFAYTAPSGFKALCDTNLPTPTIALPSTVFDTKLYTGNGSTQNITGLGFSPDLVWLKPRSEASSNVLFDAIRGTNLALYSNLTNTETTESTSLTAFNSDGFALGANNNVNKSNITYAAWVWDAGSSNATNTQGSITSTVRANASAGFSVVTWTGTGTAGTIGHGLGAVPRLIITKRRNGASSWRVYHANGGITPQNGCLFLEGTQAFTTSTIFNNTAPTSTTFGVGTDPDVNTSGGTYVAYCFAPVAGLSAFGSYTGNGNADGPFQWCGFRPRWLLVKATGAINENWVIIDALRSDSNLADDILWANLASSEFGNYGSGFDFTANGFKVRGTWSGNNSASSSYVWAAFAESPFQYARAR